MARGGGTEPEGDSIIRLVADPMREHALYTWDPVTQAWVHERGPEAATPPTPPDVHALQSYFYDDDTKDWVRTVLGPMGRELAAKWQGAYKIPDSGLSSQRVAAGPAVKSLKKSGSPVGIIIVGVVLLALVGGVGVVASQNGSLQAQTSAAASAGASAAASSASTDPSASAPASATAQPSGAAATPAPTPAGGGGGGGTTPRPTVRPTVAPGVTIPPGSQVRLADGTTVVYTGPSLVLRNTQLPATFAVITSASKAGSGVLTVILGDQRGSTQAQGIIDPSGHAVIQVLATQPSGQYPLSVLLNGQLGQVALIQVR